MMLWSDKTLNLFYERCKDDIVYLDATGSIVHKGKGQTAPFYVYEMVVIERILPCSWPHISQMTTPQHLCHISWGHL